jgi:Xaa-Pro aminopeptidase
MTSRTEIDRRYDNMRAAMAGDDIDGLVVAGSEYTGFEGAIRYMSGFQIVHRYAYVVLPAEGDPIAVFPAEARWVGVHAQSWIDQQVFVDTPGAFIREHAERQGWGRVGVYGLNYIMPVRDYLALADGPFQIVDFDRSFDLARAVKSDEELVSVRRSFALNEEGFWVTLASYAPGKTEGEIMAGAEALFVERGTGRCTMNMCLSGPNGTAHPEFKVVDVERRVDPGDLLLYSLEIAGPGGHWAEFARPISRQGLAASTAVMMEAYQEAFERARSMLRVGNTAHDVHRAVLEPFSELDLKLGHVTGHSIGMTMIEQPRIGEGEETKLAENMVISIHPHVLSADESTCLYMQETFRVTAGGGEQLSTVPIVAFDGSEQSAP